MKIKPQTVHNLEVESLGSVLAFDTILITRCIVCGVVAGEVCTTSWAVKQTRKTEAKPLSQRNDYCHLKFHSNRACFPANFYKFTF